jgi:hypothetical protein
MRQSKNNQYVCLPVGDLMMLFGAATRIYREGTASSNTIAITVRQLPEGVWLAFSDDLPGLIVETDTRDETIDLARDMALDLIELRGDLPDRRNQQFAFIFPSD